MSADVSFDAMKVEAVRLALQLEPADTSVLLANARAIHEFLLEGAA